MFSVFICQNVSLERHLETLCAENCEGILNVSSHTPFAWRVIFWSFLCFSLFLYKVAPVSPTCIPTCVRRSMDPTIPVIWRPKEADQRSTEIISKYKRHQTSVTSRGTKLYPDVQWCTTWYQDLNRNSGRSCQEPLLFMTGFLGVSSFVSWFIILSLPVVSCELYWREWQETAYVKQRKELKRRIEPLNEICTQSCVSNLTSASETKFTCMQICWRQRHQPVEGCLYSHTAVYMINSTPKCRSVYLPRSFPRKRISVNVENVKKKRG